ncbi:actin-associated protein FAM107A isoform X2 [Esox lucius]|uniref:actin-associated protein FAM107A isoform X2 n=1 Tax=Esox lucius TaxID=8010 RepID=UPI000575F13A|nr:actin-associated protein FAM107A isoform X2 [Esox lucius]
MHFLSLLPPLLCPLPGVVGGSAVLVDVQNKKTSRTVQAHLLTQLKAMGVTYGKKDIRRNKVDCPPASAHAGLLSNHDGEHGQGQGSEDLEEHRKSGGSTPELEGQNGNGSDLIIQPKKLLNPVRISRSHRELHKELKMTHKRNPCMEGKPELQRVLEQRNWKQGMEQRREAEEDKSKSLQQELMKRCQRSEELERDRRVRQEALQNYPEFIRVKESLRRTAVLDVANEAV